LLDTKSRGCVPGFFTAEKTRLKKQKNRGQKNNEQQGTVANNSEKQQGTDPMLFTLQPPPSNRYAD
jgi:hypothetical protein